MRIAIAGTGYVGLSMAVLLAQHNTVTAVDIVPEKADLINRRISPIADSEIQEYLSTRPLDLTATTDGDSAYRNADLVLISTPTNYDPDQNYFDTSSVESVIRQVMAVNPSAAVVIRSTVPVGFTESARIKHGCRRLLFSPEFLREGRALYDNLYPSRIVVGVSQDDSQLRQTAEDFAALLREGAVKKDIPVRFMAPTEAEAVKLFANTYLALRVSYFNELDTYAQVRGLDTRAIIEGVCLDPRIGDQYNNPSFGYGGYCLPKDTRQLLASCRETPQTLIGAAVSSNGCRKSFIARQICRRVETLASQENSQPVVGIYRLAMKSGSDNFRCSAIFDVMEQLRQAGVPMLLYEPALTPGQTVDGCRRTDDLAQFKSFSSLIVANRLDDGLSDVQDKVYTRDIFGRD